MMIRPDTISVLPQSAPSSDDMVRRMALAAKMHQKASLFRDTMPDITGQDSDHDVRIKHRHNLYLG